MKKLLAAAVLSVILMLCLGAQSIVEVPSEPKTKTIQIISTSDVHGKMLPYDYAKNREDLTGSLAQISTCIKQIRDDNTILIDLGDNLQGNFAHLYLDDAIHPIAHAQNMMGYDFCIPGNHEFNYGMEEVFEFVWQHEATFLCANLYYDNMENYRIFQPYAIVEKDGVRIGIIGVVTPEIMVVDFANLPDGHVDVTNPVTEIKQIAAEIRDDVDILIAACHMDLEDEPGIEDSGVISLAEQVPELDIILASHGHQIIDETYVNGVLITENKNAGATLSAITVTLEETPDGRYRITDRTPKTYYMKEYEPDPMITEDHYVLEGHKYALAEVTAVIGYLENESLAPEDEIPGISSGKIMDTALTRLMNEVQLFYSGADVSATNLLSRDINLYKGPIRKCDISVLYKYDNTLYLVEMTGKQLLKYLEWSFSYFNTFHDGDLTFSFSDSLEGYEYKIFSGLRFEVDISQPAGNRIRNLTLGNGEPVVPDGRYLLTVNDYAVKTRLIGSGSIFDEEDGEIVIYDVDVGGGIGGITELIIDYIANYKMEPDENGIPHLKVEDVDEGNAQWKLTGYHWDEQKHLLVGELVRRGYMQFSDAYISSPITESDLDLFLEQAMSDEKLAAEIQEIITRISETLQNR